MDPILGDGGPAFPRDHAHEGHNGMSLRDYFAAKAMQAAATNPVGADGFTFDQRAEWAYLQADAMLKARAAK
jgi:hypothetical protein